MLFNKFTVVTLPSGPSRGVPFGRTFITLLPFSLLILLFLPKSRTFGTLTPKPGTTSSSLAPLVITLSAVLNPPLWFQVTAMIFLDGNLVKMVFALLKLPTTISHLNRSIRFQVKEPAASLLTLPAFSIRFGSVS